jgi:DNA topoisomerase VI subunit B
MPSTASKRSSGANREAFVLNRQLEFFDQSELEKQLGHPRYWWHSVLVAELVDNSLDHCEEFGILPCISVTVKENSISVTDNGRGIPPEVVASMVDFDSRTSSRLNYACPTRGAQGNAAKCLFALPFVVNGTRGSVEIDAAGVCHKIVTTMDTIARMPVIEHTTETGKVQIGTSITVDLPSTIDDFGVERIVSLLGDYSLFNRHAEFQLDQFGKRFNWSRSSDSIDKWTAKNPDPSQWYDLDSFKNLIASCIQHDRQRSESRTVREFIRQFAGLKRSDTISSVLAETGLARCDLSSFVTADGVDNDRAEKLLEMMQASTEAPKPIKLGVIGRQHIESAFGGPVEYKRIQGTCQRGLPFIVEAAFCEVDEAGLVLSTGVNFSVDVRSPSHDNIDSLLAEFRVDEDSFAKVLVHITTPRVQYTNRGKTEINTCSVVDDAVEQALKFVTKSYTAKIKAYERDASQREKHALKSERSGKISLKEAIFRVMEESIDGSSAHGATRFDARSHFYRVRPLVQKYTDAELSQKYLDNVIDDWELKHGIIENRTRDPRGFLLEPHTGKQIPLGTTQVEEYDIPFHLYHTVIYVEKKGSVTSVSIWQDW